MGNPDFESSMKRILSETGLKTQVQLASLLGIRQSSISDAKRRGSIPADWLLKLFFTRNLNPDYLLNGEPALKYLVPSGGAEGGMTIEQLRAQIRAELATPRTKDDVFSEFRAAYQDAEIRFPSANEIKMRMAVGL